MLIDKVLSLPRSGKVTELFLLLFLILVFFPCGRNAYANTPYTLWAETGTNDMIMEVTSRDFLGGNNRAGATINMPFISAGNWYAFYNLPEQAPTYPLFVSADTVLPVSNISDGFYKLDDKFDVSVSIRSLNTHGGNVWTVPFDWRDDGFYTRLPLGINKMLVVVRGTIRLRLRRDISADEAFIPYGRVVAKVYAKLQPESVPYVPRGPIPVTTIVLRSEGAPYPISCNISINNQNAYDVKFGNLNSAEITTVGSHYAQALPLFYKCNAKVNIPIKIKLIAENSSFSTDYISTSNPDIGIIMKYGNAGRIVKPMGDFTGNLINGQGTEMISFAPVKKPGGKAIKTGDFTASAVLMVSFE